MRYKLFGYDISHYQAANFVRNHINSDFIVAKASEGKTMADINFYRYAQDCYEHGIAFGAYHFCHPELNKNPNDEAINFIKVCDEYYVQKSLSFIALDVEGKALSVQGLAEWCGLWIACVKTAFPMLPIYIYTSASNYKLINTVPQCDGVWIAHYDDSRWLDNTVSKYGIPEYRIIMKQHTSNQGKLDEDTMYLDEYKIRTQASGYNKDRLAEINRTLKACYELIDKEFVNV